MGEASGRLAYFLKTAGFPEDYVLGTLITILLFGSGGFSIIWFVDEPPEFILGKSMKKFFILLLLWGNIGFSKSDFSDSILLDPIFDRYYACAEHQLGQFKELGDELGTDCFIMKLHEVDGRKWLRSYRSDGHKNEDWFGWQQNVLSPINGTVDDIHVNEKTNQPGISGAGLAYYLIIKGADELNVMLAHVMDVRVKKGQKVTTGQAIATVGNNGQSWHPHIHIGAWRKKMPLQIRFNQAKIKNL